MGSTFKRDERLLQRLKLRDLRVLLSAAETGSMGKAAAELAISQPAVSKAINEIEHVVGVRVLDRTAQGVEPTAYGRALLKWTVSVFDDLRQATKDIESLSDPGSGEVRIGTTDSMIAGFVPATIDRFRVNIPRLSSKWSRRLPSRTSTKTCEVARSISSRKGRSYGHRYG